jgi:hypothetical protein
MRDEVCIESRQTFAKYPLGLQCRHTSHGVFGEGLRHEPQKISLVPRHRQPLLGLHLEATTPAGKIANSHDVALTWPTRRRLPQMGTRPLRQCGWMQPSHNTCLSKIKYYIWDYSSTKFSRQPVAAGGWWGVSHIASMRVLTTQGVQSRLRGVALRVCVNYANRQVLSVVRAAHASTAVNRPRSPLVKIS